MRAARAFLYGNALLFCLAAAVATLAPARAAAWLGLAAVDATGRSELLVVYGGLEAGAAVAFALAAARPPLVRPALALAAILFAAMATWRWVAIAALAGIGARAVALGTLEAVEAAVAFALWARLRS